MRKTFFLSFNCKLYTFSYRPLFPFLLFPQALLERRFLELRDRGRRLEELLPRRVSSEEQREVLGLLCKVHELEIENAEMQSHALLKDNVIRQKNFVVQRFEQHRHLCDEIIQRQRQFIDGESSTVHTTPPPICFLFCFSSGF